jgi:hypothetical protein
MDGEARSAPSVYRSPFAVALERPWGSHSIVGICLIDALNPRQYCLDMQKKMLELLKKWERVRGISEHEKILFARSLAATPDERWRMHVNFLRSHGLSTRSQRRAFGFKSPV